MSGHKLSIFTHMHSLLTPCPRDALWPVSLKLPVLLEAKETTQPANKHRRSKLISACPHTFRKYYAKSMCRNCYQKFGRKSKVWNCEHTALVSFAKGKCQSCYMRGYYQARKTAVARVDRQ
mmetsp:Transcript_23537/g.41701  ORF Transcript_23537/g.41701 Transcript_23537/m.41701 type:complete len:121 (-) Transcript_23537:38-400(-)